MEQEGNLSTARSGPEPRPRDLNGPGSIRFIHTADWQLGMTRHFLDPDAQARFTAARIEAIARLGQVAQEQECSFVVVCGDVFETNHVERRVVVRALEAMEAAPVDFYLLPGNHDPLDASAVFRSATFVRHQPPNVKVLDRAGVHVHSSGVELVAAPWTSKHPLTDPCYDSTQGLSATGALRILVGHGAIDVLAPDLSSPAIVRQAQMEALLDAGIVHYVALGDRHSTTPVGQSGRIWYSGAPEPTAHDEVDPGNVLVVELSPDSVHAEPVAIAQWQFLQHEAHLNSSTDVADLAAWLGAVPDKARAIVKLSLVGTLPLAAAAQLDEVLAHHADLMAALDTWERHTDLVVLPTEDDLSDLGLGGFAQQALEDLQDLAHRDSPEAVTARDALGLLYRLGRTPA